jgi:hydroxyacylglutathione hydrolase
MPAATSSEALQVWLVPALSDNVVPVLACSGQAVVVDPAEAEPVLQALEERDLELVAILHTHHHHDHIGGTPGLLQRWPQAAVIAAAGDRARIPLQTRGVIDGDRFTLLNRAVEVLAVPGHTAHHIAFYLPAVTGSGPGGEQPGELFCGDTLFAGGCGRLFEGTPAQMQASLARFAALPAGTRVWCAHDYTETNLRWAAARLQPQDPAAGAVNQRLAEVRRIRSEGGFTIPSTIALELATNLFLQAGSAEELAVLRQHKDSWRG